jgi:ABC-2 type transport system permease protein
MSVTQLAPRALAARIGESSTWKTLRAATWLEWQTRGNWTSPLLYVLFLLLKPLTAALILVMMYRLVSGPNAHAGIYGYLVVGSAAWSFVDQVMAGLPQAVLADREEYAMLKYVYITPQSLLLFLIGRSVPRSLMATISFVVTLAIGILFLGVPIDLLHANYLLLLLALLLGFFGIVAFGIILAGTALVLKRGAFQMPEAVAGALYLVAGVIFPIAILPVWLRDLSLAMPMTYWLELIRRALLGSNEGAAFPVTSTPAIVGLLVLTSALFIGISYVVFRISDYQARERGQIDRTTGY